MRTIFIRRVIQSFLVLAILFPLHPVSSARRDPLANLKVLRSDEHGLLLELETSAYRLDSIDLGGVRYDTLALQGASLTSQPGEPQLPQVSALIGVPPGATVHLNILSEDLRPIPGRYRLPPAAQPAPQQDEFSPGGVLYREESFAYASSLPYPPDAARLVEAGWQRDQRLARLELFPFQYIPAEGRLNWRSLLLVEVTFEYTASTGQAAAAEPGGSSAASFDALLADNLLNASAAKDWRAMPAGISAPTPSLVEPLSEPAYRIPIEQDGLYRLTYAALQGAGLDVANLDPLNLHLSSQGQAVAMYVHNIDGNEHQFSPGEYLAFYGQKFYGDRLAELYQAEDDHWLSFNAQNNDGSSTTWSPQINAIYMEQYTDENVYWLSLQAAPGLAMAQLSALPLDAPIAQTYRHTARAEQSVYWVANQSWTLHASEDTWFWNKNYTTNPDGTTWVYPISLSAVASGTYTATLRGEVISISSNDVSSPDHHTTLYLNDSAHSLPIDDHFWDGKSRYHFDADLPHDLLVEGANSLDFVAYKTDLLPAEDIYFDWFEIEYERLFLAEEDEIAFAPPQPGTWRYQVGGFQESELGVLDITTPLTPTWLTGAVLNGETLEFQLTHAENARFYAGKFTDLPSAQIEYYQPPDPTVQAQYLVITHADFAQPAQRLADYRQSQGITTQVIDIQDVYNQFNYGIFNPLAIKRFLKYTFEQWAEPPEYVVLVGDGTWNFKGSPRYNDLPIYMPPNLAWVDPWSGIIDSANSLAAVVGEDILPDLFISRMPVNTAAQLDAVVDKIIAYEATPRQDWQRNLLFIADNVPDPAGAGDFVQFSENIIADYAQPGFTPLRIYENNFGCLNNQYCPPVNHAITLTLNLTGTLLVNYVGHGAINRWSNESILTPDDINSLSNGDRLPVVLSLTCLDGHWYHPGIAPNRLESLMEEMLRTPDKGMAASFSPTGFGVTTGHDWLHRGFYEALFNQGVWSLGQLAEAARLHLYATNSNLDLVQTFTVFGDPALELKSPYSLETSPNELALSGPPGAMVEYNLQVTNTGVVTDTISFAAGGNSWQATLPVSITLPAEGDESVSIVVQIPADAGDGDSDTLAVRASSTGDLSQWKETILTTTAYLYGSQLALDMPSQIAAAGKVVTYTLQVYNDGAFADSFALSLAGNSWPATVSGDLLVGPLAPGEAISRTIQVAIPPEISDGQTDSLTVTATSQGDSQRQSQVVAATTGYYHALQLGIQPSAQQGAKGELLRYTLLVKNPSGLDDVYDLGIQSGQWDASLGMDWLALPGGASASVLFSVQVPFSAAPGESDQAVILARSRGNPDLSATVQVTSALRSSRIYLPRLEK
jgi:hypothetical protein